MKSHAVILLATFSAVGLALSPAASAQMCGLAWDAPANPPTLTAGATAQYQVYRQETGQPLMPLIQVAWGTTTVRVPCPPHQRVCWRLTLQVRSEEGVLHESPFAASATDPTTQEVCYDGAATPPPSAGGDSPAPTPEITTQNPLPSPRPNMATLEADAAAHDQAHREASGINAALARIQRAQEAIHSLPPLPTSPATQQSESRIEQRALPTENPSDVAIDVSAILMVYRERLAEIQQHYLTALASLSHTPARKRHWRDGRATRWWLWARRAQREAYGWAVEQVQSHSEATTYE